MNFISVKRAYPVEVGFLRPLLPGTLPGFAETLFRFGAGAAPPASEVPAPARFRVVARPPAAVGCTSEVWPSGSTDVEGNG